jgi:hypothetical protein
VATTNSSTLPPELVHRAVAGVQREVQVAHGHPLFCSCAGCEAYSAALENHPDQDGDIGSDIEREADADAHFAPVHNYG